MPAVTGAGPHSAPLAGFWLGGFEGADHVNAAGQPLDLVLASGHLARLDEDHRRARQAGLHAVRESIGWRLAEDAQGRVDLARARHIAASARRHGLQVVWTLMHYGLPADLSLHDDRLIGRFARFAAEVARVLGRADRRPPVFNLINEISYLAWCATRTDHLAPPNGLPPALADAALDVGYTVKRRLVRATLAAMEAVLVVEPRARFLHVDPVLHVTTPEDRPELAEQAATVRGWQWQAWDLLCGRAEPTLGGHAGALDLIGLNHYGHSQWEVGSEARLEWHRRDPRRLPLADLLREVWQRYRRPLVLAETSHVGVGRAAWLHDVAEQVRRARHEGLPVLGLCLYPLTDRPDWHEPARWHRSGLWHVAGGEGPGASARVAEPAYAQALRAWQRVLPGAAAGRLPPSSTHAGGARPPLLVFSHLRWGGLGHRLRHLLQRLALRWSVVVVEEPLDAGRRAPALDGQVHGPQLRVLVPSLPGGGAGFAPAQQAALHALLRAWWRSQGLPQPLALISTPMALPLARAMQPCALVYDCADELAGFLHPPPGLAALEREALATADRVWVAGHALGAARARAAGTRLRHLPNGADPRHWRPGGPVPGGWAWHEAALLRPPATGPHVGYMGAIDERLDLALLDQLAQARPHWHWVMVGPVVKIDPQRLPRRANLHWLGEQPYALLPGLVAGWRALLLPFVDSLATRHAAPLKLLEALAAGCPVVAADLPGVRDQCRALGAGAAVRCVPPGGPADPWLRALDAAVQPGGAASAARVAALPRALHWDRLAQRADRQLLQALAPGPARALPVPAACAMPTA